MSLDDSDAQHLVVLGLSASGEKDALQGLLAAAKGSAPSTFGGENDWDEVDGDAARLPPPETTANKPEQSRRNRKAIEHKKEDGGDLNGRGRRPTAPQMTQASRGRATISSSAVSVEKEVPANMPVSVAFHADDMCDCAESLPPLKDLVHTKVIRPLTEALNVTSLTRIQKLCWMPMIDKTRDVLIRSETGSGKTLAYALPLLHRLLCDCDAQPLQRQVGTIIIILCPTRELVVQVTDVLGVLTRCALFLTVGGIHGGENRHKEKARLRKGIPILVSTPGRLLDHLKATTSFRVEETQTIVLDEADRLLDMGFEHTLREIMELLLARVGNAGHQGAGPKDSSRGNRCLKRVLVSATITEAVERLSHFALRSNVVRVGETQDTFSIPSSLRQHYTLVPTKHRVATLISFLRSQLDAGAKRIIVFVSTADSAEFHYFLLSRLKSPFAGVRKGGRNYGLPQQRAHRYSLKKRTEEANRHTYDDSEDVVTFDEDSDNEDEGETQTLSETNAILDVNIFKLHGNMTQVDRASVFHAFKDVDNSARCSGKGVLFCTDVAARGLDMPKVDWIVHYDPPTDPACYVHRIGRTARIGNVGDSMLFLMPHEEGYASYLSNFIASESKATSGGDKTPLALIEEKKYESFLFYLTKLDPKANHMWMHSTATLERAISRLVMKRDADAGSSMDDDDGKNDDLTRLALFAYQSYIRAYSGHSRELKRLFFDSDSLHLGHVAQSFGVDKKPSEVRMQLQSIIREDRKISRETSSRAVEEVNGRPRKRLQVEVRNDDRYRSTVVQKQRKVTRDWYERKKRDEPTHRALHFTEFDA